MTRLRCLIETDGPVLVARLVGALGLAAARDARQLLVKALADQPDALLVDLSEFTYDDPQALHVFSALARRASLWPGVPVILSAPDPPLRAALVRYAIDQVVAVCADQREAAVLARGAPAPPRLRETMQPVSGAARYGRDLATEACLRWDSPQLVPKASIVVSELVTNAVQHARTPFELTLARTIRYLHIGVRDEDPRQAVRQDPDILACSGRGLRIVEAATTSWGSTPAQRGKVVWAVLAAPIP
jgi:anti-anti-sigma regulatory factor/anti-sigma regulatory factor (Ser/Thr protein kinase)